MEIRQSSRVGNKNGDHCVGVCLSAWPTLPRPQRPAAASFTAGCATFRFVSFRPTQRAVDVCSVFIFLVRSVRSVSVCLVCLSCLSIVDQPNHCCAPAFVCWTRLALGSTVPYTGPESSLSKIFLNFMTRTTSQSTGTQSTELDLTHPCVSCSSTA